jgi:hypothetical protein
MGKYFLTIQNLKHDFIFNYLGIYRCLAIDLHFDWLCIISSVGQRKWIFGKRKNTLEIVLFAVNDQFDLDAGFLLLPSSRHCHYSHLYFMALHSHHNILILSSRQNCRFSFYYILIMDYIRINFNL